MKKAFFILSFIFAIYMFNFGPIFANNNLVKPTESDPIKLTGEMTKTGTRTIGSEQPISAYQYSGYIEVSLSRFLGVISIEIYDSEYDIVYDETVDSADQSDLQIDTSGLTAGEYTIQFTNSQGQYLCGIFMIK